jgi:hypothetical protein
MFASGVILFGSMRSFSTAPAEIHSRLALLFSREIDLFSREIDLFSREIGLLHDNFPDK